MAITMEKEFLSIDEIAKNLDVTRNTVRRLIDTGKLPAKLIGRQYRVKITDFEEYLKESDAKPKEEE